VSVRAAWLLVLLGLPPAAGAQGRPEARTDDTADLAGLLDAPVVTGVSRGAESESTAPATSTNITAEELRRYGIRTLDEALDLLSLGMVTEHAQPAVEVGARGVLLTGDFGNHVLLVIDGHIVNEQWGGTAYFDRSAALPIELIDHIEVILGPGSVVYGSSATLGVIHVVTKRAKDLDGVHLVLESDVPYSLRVSAGGGKRFMLWGLQGEVTGQLDSTGSQGPRVTFAPEPYGNDSVTGRPKAYGVNGPFGTWGGTVYAQNHAEIPAGLLRVTLGDVTLLVRGAMSHRASPGGFGRFDDPDNAETDRWLSLDLRFHRSLTDRLQVGAHASFDDYRYGQTAPSSAAEDCLDGQLDGCIYRLDGQARWASVELSGRLDWLGNGRISTAAGASGLLRFIATHQAYADVDTGVSPPIAGDLHRLETAGAVWLEQTARLSDLLSLDLGARYDVDQRFGGHLSPRAAVAFTGWPGGTLKALYAEAFRAPTAYERYYADPLGSLASPDLRPEVVRSVELVAEQRLGRQRLRVGGFRSWWRDLVVSAVATPAQLAAAKAAGLIQDEALFATQYRNASALDSYGVDVAFDGAAERLRYAVGATVAHSRATAGAGAAPTALAAATPAFGNARVAYELGGDLPTVALVGRAYAARPAAKSEDDPPPQTPAGAELRLVLSGDVPGLAALSYRASGTVGTADQAPYVVGPMESTSPDYPTLQLSPVRRWSVGLGLQYVFR
jgi:outer membrane receptor protein involved in Fe transport